MFDGKGFEVTAMALSFCVLCIAYLIIVKKDGSWINWATPVFFFSLGGRYFFQFAYLYLVNPGGSRYAYFICYTAYALPFLAGALVYAFIKPIKLRISRTPVEVAGVWPWIFLLAGFLLYLPILIQFRAYLSNPRHIYEFTRTGYGIWSYGSTTLLNLALIVYLFKRNKSILGAFAFYTIMSVLTYLHGSKGLLLNCFLIWVLHRVYAERKVIRAAAAAALLAIAATLVIGSFAFFSNAADIAELFESITGFADYVRLAMYVVDDEHGQLYYGRLNLENEFYGRVPRVLMPDKPKDFGPFLLGKIYNPANYRADQGTGAVDFGEDYADFGPFAIVVRCVTSACMGWLVSMATLHLRQRRSPGMFVVFLFLAGGSVIPITGPFLLPEYLVLAAILSMVLRLRFLRRGSVGASLVAWTA